LQVVFGDGVQVLPDRLLESVHEKMQLTRVTFVYII
jgi:hypothetical protein